MLNYMSYGQLFRYFKILTYITHIIFFDRVDTSSLYGTIFILTSFIFVFNLIMEWRFYLSPLTISGKHLKDALYFDNFNVFSFFLYCF